MELLPSAKWNYDDRRRTTDNNSATETHYQNGRPTDYVDAGLTYFGNGYPTNHGAGWTSNVVVSESKPSNYENIMNNNYRNGLSTNYVDSRTTRCGFFSWRPNWLQIFANHKIYLALYSLIGIVHGMTHSYTTVVLSTIEKQFGLKSQEVAWIYSGNEFSQILFIFFLPFVGRVKRRPLFMGLAIMLSVIGLLMMALPHLTSETAARVNLESRKETQTICNAERNSSADSCDKDVRVEEYTDYVSLAIMFFGMFIVGIGGSFYYVFGLPYGDDNTEKSNSPMLIGIVLASKLLGPCIGYFLGAACLKVYVNPLEETDLKEGDSKYLGAWWLGYPIVGAIMMLCAPWLTCFPQRLDMPNTDAAKIAECYVKQEKHKSPIAFFKDLLVVCKRLLSIKLYVLNLVSVVLFLFGIVGYSTFLPKYLEFHYRQKASTAGSLGGISKTVSGVAGCLLSGWLMGRFKFHAKYVATWNVTVRIFASAAFLIFMALQCPKLEVRGDGVFSESCNVDCHCQEASYHPICSGDGETVYFSPCQAGCSEQNGSFYGGCKCLNLESFSTRWWDNKTKDSSVNQQSTFSKLFDAKSGYCPVDCTMMFYALLGILFAISFVGSTTKPSNALLMLRSINPKDKAASLTLTLCVLSLFGFLPSPFVYGHLMDRSCLIWDVKCGSTRNCLVYDTDMMRYLLNGMTAIFVFLAGVSDGMSIYYARNLDLYDQEDADKRIEEDRTQSKANEYSNDEMYRAT